MKTQFTQGQINEVMEKRGCTRKAALRWLNRNKEDRPKGKTAAGPAKVGKIPKPRHGTAIKSDSVRVPGIGDIPLVEAPKTETIKPNGEKLTPAQVSANRREGLRLFALSGKPKKEDFIRVFGAKGDRMTWEQRATSAGLDSAEEAAKQFQKLLSKASR